MPIVNGKGRPSVFQWIRLALAGLILGKNLREWLKANFLAENIKN